jgi:hypothetical protein
MGNVKIKYLGFGIQNLDTTNIEDAIWHLGAKYGAIVYNAAFKSEQLKSTPKQIRLRLMWLK